MFAYWGVVLARRARLTFTERLLDVGCGTGSSLIPASQAAAFAVGLDRSSGMLEHVPWPVPLVHGDAEALPYRDASFNVVLSGFVLFFLPNPSAGAAEIRRVLAPGGRTIVSAPEADIPAAVDVKRTWSERLGVRPPQSRSPTWGEEVLRSAGFERIEVSADTHTFTFVSGDEYVAWNRTHGARRLFDALSGDDLSRFESELAAAAESARDGEVIPMPTTARFWLAYRDG